MRDYHQFETLNLEATDRNFKIVKQLFQTSIQNCQSLILEHMFKMFDVFILFILECLFQNASECFGLFILRGMRITLIIMHATFFTIAMHGDFAVINQMRCIYVS